MSSVATAFLAEFEPWASQVGGRVPSVAGNSDSVLQGDCWACDPRRLGQENGKLEISLGYVVN